jgi:hypothetical protein
MADSAEGTQAAGDTGWRFTGVKDSKVGFYLQDVSHDDHWFADSIRLER